MKALNTHYIYIVLLQYAFDKMSRALINSRCIIGSQEVKRIRVLASDGAKFLPHAIWIRLVLLISKRLAAGRHYCITSRFLSNHVVG